MPHLEKGLTVAVKWSDGRHYFGKITRVLPRGLFRIRFEDGQVAIKRSKSILVLMTFDDYQELCRKLPEYQNETTDLRRRISKLKGALSAARSERDQLELKLEAAHEKWLSLLPRSLREPKLRGRHQSEIATASNSVIYGD